MTKLRRQLPISERSTEAQFFLNLRDELKMTQAALGAALGVSHSAVAWIESAERNNPIRISVAIGARLATLGYDVQAKIPGYKFSTRGRRVKPCDSNYVQKQGPRLPEEKETVQNLMSKAKLLIDRAVSIIDKELFSEMTAADAHHKRAQELMSEKERMATLLKGDLPKEWVTHV